MRLENDPANPCVGCGPEHPWGLRLAFEREDDRVWTRLHVTPLMVGWPQRLHSGLLYLAMLETANWTVYGMLGRAGLPVRTSALDARRLVRVGETLTLAGTWDEGARKATVAAHDEAGVEVARLERAYDLPTRAQMRERLGADAFPPEFEEMVPEP